MDLRYTAAEQQFRADLREWLGDVLPGLGPEPHREDWDARRAWDTGWQRMLVRRRVRGHQLAEGVRRPRRHAHRAPHLHRGDRARPRPVRRHELRRPAARRPDAHRRGVRRAEGVPPARDPQGRARVVPGLLRAQRRLRPRQPPLPRGPRRRRLRHQRPEDLDQLRPHGRLLRDARAHRPRGAEAQGHHLADRADEHAGHRHPPARDHGGHRRVLRGVLRRRARPGGQPGRRRERRLARRRW